MKTQSSKTRTRTRSVEVNEVTPEQKLHELMAQVYVSNKEMNAAKKRHDDARKHLYSGMKDLGLKNVEAVVQPEPGVSLPIVAYLETPTVHKVDVKKFRKLVGDEVFVEAASVTQASAKKHVGSAVLNQVLVTTEGNENVVVEVKG